MSKLNRDTGVYSRFAYSGTIRPLAKNHSETAKHQAYILRDLIQKHTGGKLTGGDVTDAFALTYHGCEWAKLQATLRDESDVPYFAVQARDVTRQLADYLQGLTGFGGHMIRAVLDMPRESYQSARTLEGAVLATILRGEATWDLKDCSGVVAGKLPKGLAVNTDKVEGITIFDGRTDRALLAKHFTSDPVTNAELVRCYSRRTGEIVDVPVEDIRYVKRGPRPDGLGKDSYVLSEHTRTESAADSFYKNALSYALARHWYNAGNDLYVMVFHGGDKTARCQLSTWDAQGRDFDAAMLALREFYGMGNVVFLPQGLSDTHHPDERWGRKMSRTRAVLPEVEAADREFRAALDDLAENGAAETAIDMIKEATRKYNITLVTAAVAYWKDTREVNGFSGTMSFMGIALDADQRSDAASLETTVKVLKGRTRDDKLYISGVSPLAALRDLAGLNPDGSEKDNNSNEGHD